jgi:cytochrome c551/c552
VLRSIAELAAYGTLAVLLTAASLTPRDVMASSATTSNTTTPGSDRSVAAARGEMLFAMKGCVGCHMHSAFPTARMQVGPDLTDLPLRAAGAVAGLDAKAYVEQSLRVPGAYPAAGRQAVMPDLHLSDNEVDSLSAFLLSSSR